MQIVPNLTVLLLVASKVLSIALPDPKNKPSSTLPNVYNWTIAIGIDLPCSATNNAYQLSHSVLQAGSYYVKDASNNYGPSTTRNNFLSATFNFVSCPGGSAGGLVGTSLTTATGVDPSLYITADGPPTLNFNVAISDLALKKKATIYPNHNLKGTGTGPSAQAVAMLALQAKIVRTLTPIAGLKGGFVGTPALSSFKLSFTDTSVTSITKIKISSVNVTYQAS